MENINRNNSMKISRFKRKNDSIFYDICIKAIDKSDDDLYNKKDYIKEIKSLKVKFLKKIKKNKKKIFEKKNTFEKTMIMGRTTFDELLNKHRIKENIISTLSTKVDDLPKIEIKKEAMKEENRAIKKYFLGRQSKYSIFKHIKDYLQSNDITLNEIIQKNPFQSRPFIIQGSE